MNLPNIITFARLCSVPIVVWLILSGQVMAAFWVFFIAALSDAVDGIIAKHLNAETVCLSRPDRRQVAFGCRLPDARP
jgi:cardiolipin synthase